LTSHYRTALSQVYREKLHFSFHRLAKLAVIVGRLG
jgi:hypothetical protein